MSKYGSSKDSEGREITSDSDFIAPEAGIIEGIVLTGVDMDEEGRGQFTFKQPNGAEVKHKEFEGEEDWQIDGTNKRVKHIATKFVDEDEYQKAVEGASSFEDFIKRVKKVISSAAKKKPTFRVKFVYNKKNFVGLPLFPNFIESDKISKEESSIKVSTRWDRFEPWPDADSEKPKAVAGEEEEAPWGEDED